MYTDFHCDTAGRRFYTDNSLYSSDNTAHGIENNTRTHYKMGDRGNTTPADMHNNVDRVHKVRNRRHTYKKGKRTSSDNSACVVRNTHQNPRHPNALIRILPNLLPQHALSPFFLLLDLHAAYSVPEHNNLKTHDDRVVYNTQKMPPLQKAATVRT